MSTESDRQQEQQQKVAARVLIGYAVAVLLAIIVVVAVGRVFHLHMAAFNPVPHRVTLWHYHANPQ